MLPVQVTIRDIPNSVALENHLRDRAQKLTQFYDRITSCHVVVKVPQKHKHQGKLYSLHITLIVPGKELVVNRKKDEDIYVVVRDAFNALERQLENYTRRKRGNVKSHDHVNRGQVTRMFIEEGYGFITGIDGAEVYFSAANVTFPTFEKLVVGDVVQFLTVAAGEGIQAQRVTRGKHSFPEEDQKIA